MVLLTLLKAMKIWRRLSDKSRGRCAHVQLGTGEFTKLPPRIHGLDITRKFTKMHAKSEDKEGWTLMFNFTMQKRTRTDGKQIPMLSELSYPSISLLLEMFYLDSIISS